MNAQIPISVELAIYASAIGILVIAGMLLYVLARLHRQLDRVVTKIEALENELIPMAREGRVMMTRARDLSDRLQQVLGAASDLVLPPVLAFNKTSRILQTAAATFVTTLWNGRTHARPTPRNP